MVGINTLFSNIHANPLLHQKATGLRTHSERVASGARLNSAADDPAGLAVAVDLEGRVRSGSSSIRTLNDKISLTSIADGAIGSGIEITDRLAELATQAANGTLSDSQRQILNKEYTELSSELQRISESTQFNGQPLFGQQSASNGSESLSLPSLNPENLGLATDLTTQEGARNALAEVLGASQTLSSARSDAGAFASTLGSTLQATRSQQVTLQEAASRITDADIASESASLVANTIGLQASVAVQAQANVQSQNASYLLTT